MKGQGFLLWQAAKDDGLMKKLYFECSAGVSGDMTVAALLDLGADEEKLMASLKSLPLDGYSVCISRVKKSGLDACDFNVILDEVHENHDYDMQYLHGSGEEHAHSHHHDHHQDHGEHHHEHHHRGPQEVYDIIDGSSISDGARAIAKRVFEIIAGAEAKAHGVPVSEVHFHEVGAVDSIVDVVAAAVCLDDLGISDVIVSPLAEGYGAVRCQHGIIPVPVPAVANIAAEHGIILRSINVEGELVTPTGAAIMAAAGKQTHLPENYRILKVGLGAGKRDYPTSGVVRAMIIEPVDL